MKTAWPEYLVRSALRPGASEPMFFLTNYAPAGVTDQRGGARTMGSGSKVNKCTFPCQHEKSDLGKASGQPQRRQWHPTPVLLPGKSMDGGAWWAAVHEVTKSWTRLSYFTFTFHFHALEKEMATHSSVLAWRIPGMGEPGGLPSMGSHRVGHD